MSDTEKSASSNNKFLKGTLILTVSSIVVKVIGSLNWIILSRVLGGEGIGLYQMGFPIYLMAITLSSAGIPVAISIITAEKLAQKDFLGAKRVFNVSLRLLFVTGLVFASALFFGAHWLIDNHWIRDSRAYYSIIALAPAVFFVTFLAIFLAYLPFLYSYEPKNYFFLLTNFLGPFLVRALVFVLCPLTGRPLLCLNPL